MLLFLVILVVALPTTAQATPQVSYELGLRASARLRSLLATTQLINTQVQGLFSWGLATTQNRTLAATRLRKAAHTFLQTSSPKPTALRVVAQDQFLAISPTTLQLISEEQFNLDEKACNLTSGHATNLTCVHLYGLQSEASPDPGSFQRSTAISLSSQFSDLSPRSCDLPCWQPIISLPSNNTALSVLSSPYLEYVSEIKDMQNKSVGHVGLGLSLFDLQNILDDVVGDAPDDRVILLVDDNTKTIIAVSTPSATQSLPNNTLCGNLPVLAADCAHATLKWFATQVTDESDQLFIRGEYFGISLPVHESAGLAWHIVVVRRMAVTQGMVAFDSTEGITICILHSFVLILAIWLMVWVFKYRRMRLWDVAQPWMLIFLLLSLVLFALSAFNHLGRNTTASCVSREWLVTTATTLASVSLFSKLLRAHMNLNNVCRLQSRPKQVKNCHMVILVGILMAFQIITTALWQFIDPTRPTLHYTVNFGDIEGIVICGHSSPQLWSTRLLTICFGFGAIYLSVKTRKISQMLAESRFLITISIHGVILFCVFTIPYMLGQGTYSTAITLSAMAQAWFALAVCTALFFPRISKQVDEGDLSIAEVKQMMVEHMRCNLKTEAAFSEFARSPQPKQKPVPLVFFPNDSSAGQNKQATSSAAFVV